MNLDFTVDARGIESDSLFLRLSEVRTLIPGGQSSSAALASHVPAQDRGRLGPTNPVRCQAPNGEALQAPRRALVTGRAQPEGLLGAALPQNCPRAPPHAPRANPCLTGASRRLRRSGASCWTRPRFVQGLVGAAFSLWIILYLLGILDAWDLLTIVLGYGRSRLDDGTRSAQPVRVACGRRRNPGAGGPSWRVQRRRAAGAFGWPLRSLLSAPCGKAEPSARVGRCACEGGETATWISPPPRARFALGAMSGGARSPAGCATSRSICRYVEITRPPAILDVTCVAGRLDLIVPIWWRVGRNVNTTLSRLVLEARLAGEHGSPRPQTWYARMRSVGSRRRGVREGGDPESDAGFVNLLVQGSSHLGRIRIRHT